MNRDLRWFISELEKQDKLLRVSEEIDPELEICEFTDRISKMNGPGLLFENPTGSRIPVVTNLFGSMDRMALALGVDNLDDIAHRIESLMEEMIPQLESNLMDKLKKLPLLNEIASYKPRIVKKAPCQELVFEGNDVDLGQFPVLKTWPGDAGRFITLPLVCTKDENGRQNIGMYRMQIYDQNSTGMHIHIHHDGARNLRNAGRNTRHVPVAVALGGDPALTYAATAPLPPMISELMFAGFLRKSGVPVVRCRTVDMVVPANAEIILEGYVDLDDMRTEGPFGDHTGYYSLADSYPTFHVTCITSRENPIYPATVVGKPPQEDCYMGKATERIFLPLLKTQLPEVVDMNLPIFGVFHNFAILSIRKQYPWHAKKVMNAVWGMGQMMFTKFVIIVDEDVDVHNLNDVMWRVGNNVDPKRDMTFTDGPLDVLDHAAPVARIGTKIGIDATRKWTSEGFVREWPEDIVMGKSVKNKIDAMLRDLNLVE
ncbi:MAG: menaquinone biosynthesis decarboxylase [Acidobacteria bacterium CG_4_9_14_3_um_filter_49_7]|nr:MAG: menaquinone biosynthesis decarboxylase [Acidobacteria bacterium CG_4_9_14_3_um_filter_49_7]